jgi:DnaK suppressor protein
MTLRKEKLENYKKTLLQKREQMASDLRQSTENLINDEEMFSDSIDQAAADTDKSFIVQLKNRERDTLVQIDEALRRIEVGTFGTCERCGESISEARIKAFPFTTLCIDCKAELESEHRYPRHA